MYLKLNNSVSVELYKPPPPNFFYSSYCLTHHASVELYLYQSRIDLFAVVESRK